tara:strand:+ start:241 stop:456 length:216 start_codon:yes stop_codon:yes gene_type:complete
VLRSVESSGKVGVMKRDQTDDLLFATQDFTGFELTKLAFVGSFWGMLAGGGSHKTGTYYAQAFRLFANFAT